MANNYFNEDETLIDGAGAGITGFKSTDTGGVHTPHVNVDSMKPGQAGTGTADVIMKATTAATGTNWTAFSSQICSVITIVNKTGTTISVRIGGAGESVEIPDGAGVTLSVAANANEVSVRRFDTSNTQVDVKAIASK